MRGEPAGPCPGHPMEWLCKLWVGGEGMSWDARKEFDAWHEDGNGLSESTSDRHHSLVLGPVRWWAECVGR